MVVGQHTRFSEGFIEGVLGRLCLTSPDEAESIERHISVWKIETEETNIQRKHLNSSVIFLQFSQFSEILGKSEKKKKGSKKGFSEGFAEGSQKRERALRRGFLKGGFQPFSRKGFLEGGLPEGA